MRLWFLQVAVSELEIIALSVRVATLRCFCSLCSCRCCSIHFISCLNQAEATRSAPFGVSCSLFRCKLGQPLAGVQILIRAFREARNTARSIALTQVQHGPKRLAAISRRRYAILLVTTLRLLLSWSAEFFDIRSSLRYTVVGPRATYVSLAGAEMA